MKFKRNGQATTVSAYAKTIRNIIDTPNQLRNTLSSPYSLSIEWYKLNSVQSQEIMDDIKRLFSSLPTFYSQRKVKKGKKEDEAPANVLQEQKDKRLMKMIRSQIKIGINEVTRSLEKGELRVVIIPQPTKQNSVLTDHLKVLSATRSIPVCVINDLNQTVCQILKWKRVSAIGFKKLETKPGEVPEEIQMGVNKLVKNITRQVPKLVLPWLHFLDVELSDKVEEMKKIMFASSEKRVEFEFESYQESSTKPSIKSKKVSDIGTNAESETATAQGTNTDNSVSQLLEIVKPTKKDRKRKIEQQPPPTKKFKYENPLRSVGYRKAIVQQRIKNKKNKVKKGNK